MPTPRHYADAAARQRAYRERQQQARADERLLKGLPAAPGLATIPSEPRWQALLACAVSALETAVSEMQPYHAARSAVWQESERGEAWLERIDHLENLVNSLQELQEEIALSGAQKIPLDNTVSSDTIRSQARVGVRRTHGGTPWYIAA